MKIKLFATIRPSCGCYSVYQTCPVCENSGEEVEILTPLEDMLGKFSKVAVMFDTGIKEEMFLSCLHKWRVEPVLETKDMTIGQLIGDFESWITSQKLGSQNDK